MLLLFLRGRWSRCKCCCWQGWLAMLATRTVRGAFEYGETSSRGSSFAGAQWQSMATGVRRTLRSSPSFETGDGRGDKADASTPGVSTNVHPGERYPRTRSGASRCVSLLLGEDMGPVSAAAAA